MLYLVIPCMWEEKWPEVRIRLWAEVNDLPDWSRAWKENGRSRTRRFREEAYAWNYGEKHEV